MFCKIESVKIDVFAIFDISCCFPFSYKIKVLHWVIAILFSVSYLFSYLIFHIKGSISRLSFSNGGHLTVWPSITWKIIFSKFYFSLPFKKYVLIAPIWVLFGQFWALFFWFGLKSPNNCTTWHLVTWTVTFLNLYFSWFIKILNNIQPFLVFLGRSQPNLNFIFGVEA